MNRSALFFGLSSVVALAGFAGACSSTTTTTPGDTTPEGGTPSEAGKDSAAKDSSDTDSSTAPTADEECAAATTKSACGTCCLNNHTEGAKVLTDAVLACACVGTGLDGGTGDGGTPPCMTQCMATACKSPPANPDATCNTCIQSAIAQGGACQKPASDACTASADCLAEQKCVMPCQTKN